MNEYQELLRAAKGILSSGSFWDTRERLRAAIKACEALPSPESETPESAWNAAIEAARKCALEEKGERNSPADSVCRTIAIKLYNLKTAYPSSHPRGTDEGGREWTIRRP